MLSLLKTELLGLALCFAAQLLTDPPKPAPPPALVELHQPESKKVETLPTPPLKDTADSPYLDINKHRQFRIREGYKGPVEWIVEGTAFTKWQTLPPPKDALPRQVFAFVELQGKGWGEYELLPDDVLIRGVHKGESRLIALGVIEGRPKILLSKTFLVDGFVPDVTPKPPTPTPVPVVTIPPIGADGLYMLFVYDEKANLSEDEYAIIYGTTDVRPLMAQKCANGNAVRIWPSNVQAAGEKTQGFKDALARTRNKANIWLVATNPLKNYGFEGPVKTKAEVLEILNKYGK